MSQRLALFERTLTDLDSKQNIPFPVQVPQGIQQLTIRLRFAPWHVDDINNLITLTVFDPAGFRGAGHRHGDLHEVIINPNLASPGFRPGPLPVGEWIVQVDTHMVMPGAPCALQLEILGDAAADGTPLPALIPGKTSLRGQGWYRGDLHAHSIHSDAAWDIPGWLEWARAQKLDFCTLSDHNTVTGLAYSDAARADDLLTMGGMELTTFWGHALALGGREWVDWRTAPGARSMEQISAEVTASGRLFIIAHPMRIGDPYCTGCRWVYDSMMPGNARTVEAWNGPWAGASDNNEKALNNIYGWLKTGYKLALTAGTDNHGRGKGTTPFGFNVVYADDLREPDILRAVRAGHNYLSSGPVLDLTAASDSRHGMMGDVLEVPSASSIQVTARFQDVPSGAQLTLIADGQPEAQMGVSGEGSVKWELSRVELGWCHATLRGADGTMLALTNPIFFDGRS